MAAERLEGAFPGLKQTGYQITSPPASRYNCIAWAAGVEDDWWWPLPAEEGYWPPEAPREESIEAFVRAFATLGYLPCDDAELEPGFEKVAIYAREEKPTHAARQLGSGLWTSKLGRAEDIEHNLTSLEGPIYGAVRQILKRPIPAAPAG